MLNIDASVIATMEAVDVPSDVSDLGSVVVASVVAIGAAVGDGEAEGDGDAVGDAAGDSVGEGVGAHWPPACRARPCHWTSRPPHRIITDQTHAARRKARMARAYVIPL
jgi:hypothetical protein